jgi:NADPH2:quinone reductase
VRAVALNFFDTLITRGKYQHKPALPFSPGGEIAGVIDAFGPGAEAAGLRIGQRIAAHTGWGGAREYITVPAEAVVPIPDAVDDVVASGIAITYGTAINGLRDRGRLRPGETVAVLGASGGAGLAAVEIAKRLGARVIAVASTPEKLEVCRAHGADALVNYETLADVADLKTALREASGGTGPDVIYDCVGGPYAEPALRSLAWGGRFLVVGFAAGDIPRIPLNLLLVKGVEMVGVFWGEAVRRDPQGHRKNMIDVLGFIASGDLTPQIHGVYAIDEIKAALAVIDRREAVGKVVVRI